MKRHTRLPCVVWTGGSQWRSLDYQYPGAPETWCALCVRNASHTSFCTKPEMMQILNVALSRKSFAAGRYIKCLLKCLAVSRDPLLSSLLGKMCAPNKIRTWGSELPICETEKEKWGITEAPEVNCRCALFLPFEAVWGCSVEELQWKPKLWEAAGQAASYRTKNLAVSFPIH